MECKESTMSQEGDQHYLNNLDDHEEANDKFSTDANNQDQEIMGLKSVEHRHEDESKRAENNEGIIRDLKKQIKEKTEQYDKLKENFEMQDELLREKVAILADKAKQYSDIEREKQVLQKEVLTVGRRYADEHEKLKTLEKIKPKLEAEINRLQFYENVNPALGQQILKLERDKEQLQTANIYTQNSLTKAKQETTLQGKEIQALRGENQSLKEEKQSLLLRLSKLAGAKLTVDNPNIADLSDGKRPTKLAEEFTELYDNEWTDAFEDVKGEDDQEKSTFLLILLKRANELCREVSEEHMNGIKTSICTLTLCVNDQTIKASKRQREDRSFDTKKSIQKENSMAKENKLHQRSLKDYSGPRGPSVFLCPDVEVGDSIDSVVEDGFEIIDNTEHFSEDENTPGQLFEKMSYDFKGLRDDYTKSIMELRKFIEVSLSDQIESAVTNVIAVEHCVDKQTQGTVITYIKKCVNICWSMCRLEPPVFIGFPEVQGDMHLDTNVYKPYTKTGTFVDYIVWPTLYLHENGPILCKRVAQGRK